MNKATQPPNSTQKFNPTNRVQCTGWGGTSDSGVINEIKWIFHNRLGRWTWGYKILWENNGPGFSFTYIPEDYLTLTEDAPTTDSL